MVTEKENATIQWNDVTFARSVEKVFMRKRDFRARLLTRPTRKRGTNDILTVEMEQKTPTRLLTKSTSKWDTKQYPFEEILTKLPYQLLVKGN